MTALTLTLTQTPEFKLDCRNITPNNLAGLGLAAIKNLALNTQKNAPKLADYFLVTGTDSNHIVFKNTNNQLDYIGHKMSIGSIVIEGDCGDFLGANMQGGHIICQGNTGARLGDQMRRGLILVDGNAGDYCASRMIAGTIAIYGHVGQYAAFSMKRGSLLLVNQPQLMVTMQDCGAHMLPFMQILLRSFMDLPSKFAHLKVSKIQKFAGDLSCDGRGEILICMED